MARSGPSGNIGDNLVERLRAGQGSFMTQIQIEPAYRSRTEDEADTAGVGRRCQVCGRFSNTDHACPGGRSRADPAPVIIRDGDAHLAPDVGRQRRSRDMQQVYVDAGDIRCHCPAFAASADCRHRRALAEAMRDELAHSLK